MFNNLFLQGLKVLSREEKKMKMARLKILNSRGYLSLASRLAMYSVLSSQPLTKLRWLTLQKRLSCRFQVSLKIARF